VASSKFLCRSETLIEGEFVELDTEVNGRRLFLVATRHNAQARAWLNVCPHQGRPLNWAPNKFLSDEHGNLVCAAHGAVFEPHSGVCISGPCRNAGLTAVPLEDDGEEIRIHLDPR
jgi:nitrite reductase/ring-hydroxylating ferredoxin subunit